MHRRSSGTTGTGSPSGNRARRAPSDPAPEPRSGQRCSSKDDAVPTNPVSLRPALARRAAVVAGSAAAAALFATVPAAPAPTPAPPPASQAVTVSAPVVPLAARSFTFNTQAV